MTEEKSDELNSNGFGNEQESVNLRKKETAKSVKASPEEIVNKLVKSVDNAEVGEKASVIDGKLKLLSDLRNEGKISPQEYRQAAERILNHPDFKNHIKNDPVLAEKARLFTRGLNIKDKAESLGRFITGGGQGFSYGDMTS